MSFLLKCRKNWLKHTSSSTFTKSNASRNTLKMVRRCSSTVGRSANCRTRAQTSKYAETFVYERNRCLESLKNQNKCIRVEEMTEMASIYPTEWGGELWLEFSSLAILIETPVPKPVVLIVTRKGPCEGR